MEKIIKTIFMGTPEFAVKPLLSLLADPDFRIEAVFTNPDEPVGRKQALSSSPIKKVALDNKRPLYQPAKIKEAVDIIKGIAPDLIVVVAYGHLIPQSILDIPKYGCINVHGSLLPKYRGAACLQAPILNGDKTSGVTIIKMEAGLDTGPILKQAKVDLDFTENIITLGDKLSALSAKILAPTIKNYIAGDLKEQPQNEADATDVKMIKKTDGQIDFTKSAQKIERMARAFYVWPGIFFNFSLTEKQNKKIKILELEPKILAGKFAEPGQFFKYNNQLGLQCGQDVLIILSLQIEGKSASSGQEFINGYRALIK
ncbi:MAG: methionyl-tRNA formyltransferase [Candidatus Falkowbacteria bacterium]|nr:methionyl-tRNA formyltransferase [Candidatus Falkowbacteria bacterium]